jgi:hypothetical protein
LLQEIGYKNKMKLPITKVLIGLLCIAAFVLWWCVPTFNKWKADRLVDDLCAKDGGVKIYETVALPKERFNKYGKFLVRDKKFILPNDEYYSVWKVTNIKGKHESSAIGTLAVYQSHFWIHRTKDKKLLGESISYSRRGGDPISWVHPSAHSCAKKNSLEESLFKPVDE